MSVRRLSALIGTVMLCVGLCLVLGPFQDAAKFRHARDCAAGDPREDCLVVSSARVEGRDNVLMWQEGGQAELQFAVELRHPGQRWYQVDGEVYEVARRGDRAQLRRWHGEIVQITVRGRNADLPPPSAGVLQGSLLMIWTGGGLLLGALGSAVHELFFGETDSWYVVGLPLLTGLTGFLTSR